MNESYPNLSNFDEIEKEDELKEGKKDNNSIPSLIRFGLKVCDFGSSCEVKVNEEENEESSSSFHILDFIGTPALMSPEMILSKINQINEELNQFNQEEEDDEKDEEDEVENISSLKNFALDWWFFSFNFLRHIKFDKQFFIPIF